MPHPNSADLDHDHSVEGIRHRLAGAPRVNYLRDWIYGGIDGAVTTFAVVSGVVGAELSNVVIIILGLANVLADGFSMAASNYSGTRAEVDEAKRLRAVEARHVRENPEGERREIREIFHQKGFAGENLDRAVEVITSDRDRWIDTMLQEEYGLPLGQRSPLVAALSTFSAFVVCGLVPLLPYFLGLSSPFALSAGATAATFFLIGASRSRWALAPWWRTGLETFAIGCGAALLAYATGWVLRQVFGIVP